MKYLLIIATALLCSFSTAEAKRGNSSACIQTGDIMRPCAYNPDFLSGVRSIKVRMHRETPVETRVARRHATRYARSYQAPSFVRRVERSVQRVAGYATQMLPHPVGCPGTQFCGCGAAVEVFGSPRRDLWLAANWLRYPRTSPAPGMVAARRGHVFVLKQQMGDGSWLVADFNSGGHASRLHVRPLGGYTIVNPHG